MLRELLLSYTTGKPGSVFMVSGFGYAPSSNVTLSANGTALGEPLPVNSTGAFVAQLDTTGADASLYLIRATPQTVSVSANADTATIILDDSATLRPQEGGGTSTRTVPTGIALAVQKVFMALVRR